MKLLQVVLGLVAAYFVVTQPEQAAALVQQGWEQLRGAGGEVGRFLASL
jgi:hypothetical protein